MPSEDWFLPGGAVIDDSRQVKLRLRPPPDWQRCKLQINQVPPSMNTDAIRSWRSFANLKKEWQEELEMLLMIAKIERQGYHRALVGGFLQFPTRKLVRDPSNFARLVDKACGDALVNYTAIPDDDAQHYFFGGLEIEEQTGTARTVLWIYLQPK